jgi:multimeric flavodoxin WrbA
LKTTSILGSPRKKGNTNKVLGWVEEAFQAQGHQVGRINVVDHEINGCKGCFTCKRFPDEPGCPQKDDAAEILDQLIGSDIILYASPNYMWGLTAQMKAVIDRHCSLVIGFGTPQWRSLLQGKKVGLVVTCEDAVENNSDLMMEMFGRLADYLKCDHAGALVVPFTTTPDALGEEVREQAWAFAKDAMG